MDKALLLKKQVDTGHLFSEHAAMEYLNESLLFKALLSDFDFNAYNALNRLVEVAEIPFTKYNPKIKQWMHKMADLAFCSDGFSLLGKADDILSCYNAMITSVLIRLGYPDKAKIEKGVEWILNYQSFERGKISNWPGERAKKYGGCLKSTPCYIGVVKSTMALSDYKNKFKDAVPGLLEEKLNQGLEYILDHELFKRKGIDQPITNYILKLAYPFSYKTNIVEILRLIKENGLFEDKRCSAAKEYLLSKQKKDGYWRQNSIYQPKGWVPFDKTNEPALWLSYEVGKLLK